MTVGGFRACRRGGVAALVAAAAVPLMLMAGLAVDLTRLYLLQSRLVAATDAAALAGARAISDADRDDQVRRWFWTNFTRETPTGNTGYIGATVLPSDFVITADAQNKVLRVRVKATLPTSLMQLAGIPTMTAGADQSARRQDRGMELALVLDVTGSMADAGEMNALRGAASELVRSLYGPQRTVPNLSVAVAPYTATVNIGRNRPDWLVSGSLNPKDYEPTQWRGCVEARHENGEDQTDTPPDIRPFRPFLYRSTYNRYAPHRGDNDWRVSVTPTEPNPENPQSDAAQNAVGNAAVGPNLGCPRAILPLNPDRDVVLNEIAMLRATHRGGTASNLGLQMGWAVLSHRWQGLWGTPNSPVSDTRLLDKVLVLMTDGENQYNDWDGGAPGSCTGSCKAASAAYKPDGDTDYNAYGRLLENRLNLPQGSRTIAGAQNALNERMSRMCELVKQAGIRVYTITFALPASATATRRRFSDCASNPDFYFNSPTQDDLRGAFREISQQLANLRLVR